MKDKEGHVFDFETVHPEEHQPNRADRLIAGMTRSVPILENLIAAQSLDDQISIIQRKLPPAEYSRLLLQLTPIVYFYQHTDQRLDKALEWAELLYRVAMMLPEEWNPGQGFGLSPARQRAETLENLGSIYEDLGDLSRALEYYQQAEEWYGRDDAERSKHGITAKSDFDRVVHKRDVRAALFENMARLYRKLGDEEKVQEYALRINEIDQQQTTTETRIHMLLSIGSARADDGNFNEALKNFYEALDLALAYHRSQLVAREVVTACHHIGDTLRHLGLFRQALRYHQRALELNRQAGHLERMSYDYMAIGKIFETRPDLGDALEQYQAALRCASVAATDSGPFTLRASNETLLRVIDPDLAWPAALAIGRICAQRQIYDRADEFFELAIDLGEALRSNVLQDEYRIGFQSTRMEAYEAMIKMHSWLAIWTPMSGIRGHAIRSWKYVERARSRAFLDLLSTSPIQPPVEIPVSLQGQEAALVEHLLSLRQERRTDGTEQKRSLWDEYEDTRIKLEKVWQDMIAITPTAIEYVGMRRGQPFEAKALRELLAAPEALPAIEEGILKERAKDPKQRFAHVRDSADAFQQARSLPESAWHWSPLPTPSSPVHPLKPEEFGLIRTLEGFPSWVHSVALSLDGQALACVSGWKVMMWNPHTGQLLRTLGDSAWSVAFSPDNRILACGCYDAAKVITLWNPHTGQLLRTLEGHGYRINSLVFGPDGQTLISGSDDKTIKVWNPHTGQLLRTLEGRECSILAVAISLDGQTLVSGTRDSKIMVWNPHTGQLLATIGTHIGQTRSLAISPDGQLLASTSWSGTDIWELHTGRFLRTVGGHSSVVEGVAITPDGQTLMSGSADKTIKLWDLHSGQLLRVLEGHAKSIECIAISTDGQMLVSGSEDETIKIWGKK